MGRAGATRISSFTAASEGCETSSRLDAPSPATAKEPVRGVTPNAVAGAADGCESGIAPKTHYRSNRKEYRNEATRLLHRYAEWDDA